MQRGFGRIEKRVLMKQIFIGISGNAQFGKQNQRDALIGGLAREFQGLSGIVCGIGDAHVGHADSDADETVFVDGMERQGGHELQFKRTSRVQVVRNATKN